ncbi:MAG TPA: aromatic-ring-hydroxylating dioxygenase subunit beta [Pseudolabrys sp.]|nr:aromatic-ring-hydroxylating dioxygenase subunit beta [Pseudolabrys sp.]
MTANPISEGRVNLNLETTAIAADLLAREGLYLDRKDWKSWLALFCEDVEYWLPAWRDEYDTTDDPARQVSLIYHASRHGLAERIARIQTRKSVTAMPLPRTAHFISNVRASSSADGTIDATASWQVHAHDARTQKNHHLFGIGEYRLRREADGAWRLAGKKLILMNDQTPAVIDFYTL